MGGIHSGGVGTILLYIGCPVGGAAHYMGGESTKLGYIEAPPPCFPHYGKPWVPTHSALFEK